MFKVAGTERGPHYLSLVIGRSKSDDVFVYQDLLLILHPNLLSPVVSGSLSRLRMVRGRTVLFSVSRTPLWQTLRK